VEVATSGGDQDPERTSKPKKIVARSLKTPPQPRPKGSTGRTADQNPLPSPHEDPKKTSTSQKTRRKAVGARPAREEGAHEAKGEGAQEAALITLADSVGKLQEVLQAVQHQMQQQTERIMSVQRENELLKDLFSQTRSGREERSRGVVPAREEGMARARSLLPQKAPKPAPVKKVRSYDEVYEATHGTSAAKSAARAAKAQGAVAQVMAAGRAAVTAGKPKEVEEDEDHDSDEDLLSPGSSEGEETDEGGSGEGGGGETSGEEDVHREEDEEVEEEEDDHDGEEEDEEAEEEEEEEEEEEAEGEEEEEEEEEGGEGDSVEAPGAGSDDGEDEEEGDDEEEEGEEGEQGEEFDYEEEEEVVGDERGEEEGTSAGGDDTGFVEEEGNFIPIKGRGWAARGGVGTRAADKKAMKVARSQGSTATSTRGLASSKPKAIQTRGRPAPGDVNNVEPLTRANLGNYLSSVPSSRWLHLAQGRGAAKEEQDMTHPGRFGASTQTQRGLGGGMVPLAPGRSTAIPRTRVSKKKKKDLLQGVVNPSPEERQAAAAERSAAAHEAQARAAHLSSTDVRVVSNLTGSHPQYLMNRFYLSECGRLPTGLVTKIDEAYLSSGYGQILLHLLQEPVDLYPVYGFQFEMRVCHFVAANRGTLGGLPLGSFSTRLSDELLRAPSCFLTQPLKAETFPEPSDRLALADCGRNLAHFLLVFFNERLGQAFAALNDMCCSLERSAIDFDLQAWITVLKAALTRVDRNVAASIGAVEELAVRSGRHIPMGSTPESFRVIADLALSVGPGGDTVMTPPAQGLDPDDSTGVLERRRTTLALAAAAATAKLVAQEVEKQATSAAGGGGGGKGGAASARGKGLFKHPYGCARPRPEEVKAALTYAPRDPHDVPLCLDHLSHRGCSAGGRKRCPAGSHEPLGAAHLAAQVEVVLVQHGGPLKREGFTIPPVREEDAPMQLAKWRAVVAEEHEALLMDGAMKGVRGSAHPLEGPIREDLVRQTNLLAFATARDPVERRAFGEPDTEHMTVTRAVAGALLTAFPDLAGCPPNVLSLVFHHAAVAHENGTPLEAPDRLLDPGLHYLKMSTLEGAEEWAHRLQPPRTQVNGESWEAKILSATGARARDSKGRPLVVIFPRDQHGESIIHLFHESWRAQDMGQRVGGLDSQCVICVLAHVTGVRPEDMLRSGTEQSRVLLKSLGPMHENISLEELGMRQCAHDFIHKASHDLFLARYFFPNLFEPIRLVIVSVADSAGPVRVQVLQSATWNGHAQGARTVFVLAARNHAEVLSPPPRYMATAQKGSAAHHGAEAVLARFAGSVEVETYYHLTVAEIQGLPRVLPSSALAACLCCGERLVLGSSQRAGKCSAPVTLLAQNPPYELQAYYGQMAVVGGLKKEGLAVANAHRGGDFMKWMLTTDEIKAYPFSPEVKEKAAAFIACGVEGMSQLDKDAAKAHDPGTLERVAKFLLRAATLGDEVVALQGGSIRGASTAVRQAALEAEGSLPLDAGRLEGLRGLVGDDQLDLLQDLATMGVPLLQPRDAPPVAFEGPYASAEAGAGALGYTAVGDVARGRSLLVTEASEGALRAAGAGLSRLGATAKKDAEGVDTGDLRPVTDLRWLNAYIVKLAKELRRLVRITAPPSVCPPLRQLMRTAMYIALRFPGVAVGGGKSDMSEAFKLMHLLISDAPSTAWALPTKALPGLERKFIVQIALMLAFGFNKSPGWFGVLAWVLAEAHAALGPDEPEFNGADSYAGGAPHMDDYVMLVAMLGQRAQMAYKHYTEVTQAGGGSKATNLAKDSVEGIPKEVFRPWGRVMDLSGIPTGGPLAGKIISPPAKVRKHLAQLSSGGFAQLHLRRLTMKELAEATGLGVWLSDTNIMLKALLPSFYAALSSTDVEYVSPPGTPQQVEAVWVELSDAVALARQQCEDAERFVASFQSSLARALGPREMASLGVPRVWLQTDSTGKDPEVSASGQVVLGADGLPTYRAAIFALACFHLGVYGVDEVERFEDLLSGIVGVDRETHIIVGEMLPVVGAAMEHGEEWRGLLVTCAIDNVAVVAAVNMRASSHPFVRYLALLLTRLSALHGFTLWAYYINTKSNVLPDQLTRLYSDSTSDQLQAFVDSVYPGLERRSYTKLYDFLLHERHAKARSFALPLDGGLGAERLLAGAEERRSWWRAAEYKPGGLEGGESASAKARCVEVYGGAGNGAMAAAGEGMECVALVEAHESGRSLAVARLNAAGQHPSQYRSVAEAVKGMSAADGVDVILVAAPPPGGGKEGEVGKLTGCLKPAFVIVELAVGPMAREAEAKRWEEALRREGYELLGPVTGEEAEQGGNVEVVDVAVLGGPQRRERAVLHFEQAAWAHLAGPLSQLRPLPGPPRYLRWALEPYSDLDGGLFEQGRYVPCARAYSGSGPKPVGHLFRPGRRLAVRAGSAVTLKGGVKGLWRVHFEEPGGFRLRREGATGADLVTREAAREDIKKHVQSRTTVWSPEGVCASIFATGDEPPLVLEERGESPRVRRLSMLEVWRLQGLTLEDLRLARRRQGAEKPRVGEKWRREMEIAARTQHGVLAASVVARAQRRLEIWNRRLRLTSHPGGDRLAMVEMLGGDALAVVRTEEGEIREVKATDLEPYVRTKVGAMVPAREALGLPSTRVEGGQRRPRGRPTVSAGEGAGDTLLKAATTQLVGGSVKEGTHSTYDSSFKHWVAWRLGRQKPLYLDGRNPREDEDELLMFVAHKALNSSYAHSTIHVMLFALRFKHLMARHPDPLEDKLLLRVAMKGVSRLQGGAWRKVPASIDMIRWIVAQLDLEVTDELLVAIALVMMFLFLLRSREALRKGASPDGKQCVRGRNVVLAYKGKVLRGNDIQMADEVVLMQGASKTDPNGQGSVANVFEAPGDELCLVSLLKRLHRQQPRHFEADEDFFFKLSDGRVLHRDVVAAFLREAADAFGLPKAAVAVISLRSGGASAMWDAGYSAEEVKRRGRWASDCYQIYIWEGHDRSKDVASRMLSSKFSLMASLAAYRRQEEERGVRGP
jgi:hypothetical protein